MNQKLLLSFFIGFCYAFVGYAQEFRVIDFQEQNDKLGQYVKSVGQDSTGFIWLGTDDGLLRYDGIHFNKFDKGLPNKHIKHLFPLENGKFLASTDAGIAEIISQGDSVDIQTFIAGSEHFSDSTVWMSKQLYEDRYHNIWVSDNERLHRYKDGKLHHYNFGLENHSHDYKRSFSVAEDGYGNIYACSFTGNLFRYNPENETFDPIKLPKELHLVSAIIHVQTGIFLVASRNGLHEIILTPKGTVIGFKNISPELNVVCLTRAEKNKIYAGTQDGHLIEIQHEVGKYQFRELGQFSNNSINHVIRSKVGNYWLATDDGVVFLKRTYFQPIFSKKTRAYIHFVGKSPEGNVFFADSKNLYEVIEKDGKFETKTVHSETNFTIQSASIDQQNCWVANDNGEIIQINRQTSEVKKIKITKDGQRIISMSSDDKNRLWVCVFGYTGVFRISPDLHVRQYGKTDGFQNDILAVKSDKKGKVYFSGRGKNTYLYAYDEFADKFINISLTVDFEDFAVQDFDFDDKENIWLGTNQGLFHSDSKLQQVDIEGFKNEPIKALQIDKNQHIWLANAYGLIKYEADNSVIFTAFNGLPTKNITYRNILVDDKNRLWIGTAKGMAFSENTNELKQTPKPMFRHVAVNGTQIHLENQQFTFVEGGYVELNFLALSFPGKGVNYRYRVVSSEDSNSKWSDELKTNQLLLPPAKIGNYRLETQAKQQGNYTWSETAYLDFSVHPVWYQKWQSYILILVIIVILLLIAVRINTWRLEREKHYLENMILQRTNDIHEKNLQLEQSKEEVLLHSENLRSAYQQITIQNEEITKKNKNINAAINYAARIQSAILPRTDKIQSHFHDLMIFFQPRDTVSGDFYWFFEEQNHLFLAAADCTGHGIPGAFMSLIGNDLLNEIIIDLKIHKPKRILNELHERVRIVLKQRETGNHDGMDIALIALDTEKNLLHFSGANNPLVYIQQDENRNPCLKIIKGDKLPVGGKRMGRQRVFKQHTINIAVPTTFYLYSDGYQDQFGGEQGRKFMSRKFREMLFEIHDRPMPIQATLLKQMLKQWRGTNRQIDDILVIGAKWKG